MGILNNIPTPTEAKGKWEAEDEMVGWHHQFNRHESEQTLEHSQGQESLARFSPWRCNLVTKNIPLSTLT